MESGKSLGGGNLKNFLINSNTSSDGFLNCLKDYPNTVKKDSKPTKKLEEMDTRKRSQSVEKTTMEDRGYQDSIEFQAICNNIGPPLKCFKTLQNRDSAIFAVMKEYGSKVAPLPVIGTFLSHTGNHILNYIQNEMEAKKDKP